MNVTPVFVAIFPPWIYGLILELTGTGVNVYWRDLLLETEFRNQTGDKQPC